MKNKYLKFSLLGVFIIVAYLYLAHAYIYHTIGSAHLSATDNQHLYNIINDKTSQETTTYAAIGDSLTAGVGTDNYNESYPYLLASALAGDHNNISHLNFSYPGARTQDVINDLLTATINAQPNLVTLLIGVNDAHGYVSDQKFQNNYSYILKELSTKTNATIHLVNIPSIGSNSLFLPPYNYYYNYKIKKFNKIIKSLAETYKLNYIDLYTPTLEISQKSGPYYAADLFHPAAPGYALWAKIIYANLH